VNLADVWVDAVRQIVRESQAAAPNGITGFQAEVVAVDAGAAADGRPLVTVAWNGTEFPAAYNRDVSSYIVGDQVLVVLIASDPVILCRLGGTPPIS